VPRTGLWANADFLRLWSAQAISAFGSRITRTALPIIAVATLGESEAIVGLLAALSLAPGAVLALFSGGFVDRGHKRRILIGADLVRAAIVISLTIAWALGALTIVHLFAVGAIVGAASALFQIADVAYLPALLAKRDLAEGNAKLETTEAIAEVTGPASAGVLVAALGAPLAVAIDAASYVWSALILGRIRAVEPAQARAAPASTSMWQATADVRVGMRAIFGHPQVRPLVFGLIVWTASYGFYASLYTLFCLRTLGLPQATFGIIIAMGGIGSFAGALFARPLVRRYGLGRTLIVSSAISVVCGLLIPLAGGPRWLAIGLLCTHQLIADGFSVVFNIHQITLRQTVLRRDQLGRANAAIHACTSGLVPIAALVAGLLAQATSIRFAMWLGVALPLAAPILMLPLRTVRELKSADSSGAVSAGDVR
jgi:MFS family permease